GSDRLRSVSKLKFNDQFVQDAYNNLFEVPKAPANPKVRVAELDKAILIDWGWDATAVTATETGASGFEFEGYNIYQLPSSTAAPSQGRKLATYDLENGVATILGINLDENSGVILDVPLQIGTDFGVRRFLKVATDALRGGPLVNGQEYYFAVTAYNRNTAVGAAVTTLESSPQIQICVPQAPPPGKRFQAEAAQVLTASHPSGGSDGAVAAVVVDPTQTTGDSYKVTFANDADGATVWSLTNTSTNTVLLANQTTQLASTSASGPYIGAQGFEVRVAGPPNGMKDWGAPAMPFTAWKASADAVDANGNGVLDAADFAAYASGSSATRWWTWAAANWEAEGFNGAITGDPNAQWFGPTTLSPADLRTVELRFTSVHEEDGEDQYKPLDLANPNVSYAYRYMRASTADAPAPGDLTTTSNPYDWSNYIVNPGAGYHYQDRVPICLSAWDIERDPPRRLEVGFLENNQPGGLVNGAYGPAFNGVEDNTAGGGPREWLFIFDANYTADPAGANALFTSNNLYEATDTDQTLPHMWIIFAARRIEDRFPQDGDSFVLVANHVNSPADQFAFSVPGTVASDSLALADLELINVFPNPYYGSNTAETDPYAKFVTFSHLPTRATIRIYDLSGALVRKLEKDDGEQFLRWDLLNHNNLPVASGLYVAHIELPDLGKSRVMKLAIVQPQQFLEYF
ncbi:MAG: hypothetical protein ABIL09_24595, partial [Gemmatimonadota bacterium]